MPMSQQPTRRLPICFRVGRSPEHCDIVVEDNQRTVSGYHMELLRTGRGRLYVRDHSRNGTFIFRNQRWERIEEGYVEPDEFLSLGRYHTTAGELIRTAEERGIQPRSVSGSMEPEDDDNPQTTQVRMSFNRDPQTGKIIFPKREKS